MRFTALEGESCTKSELVCDAGSSTTRSSRWVRGRGWRRSLPLTVALGTVLVLAAVGHDAWAVSCALFESAASYPLGSGPNYVAVGDFNGDSVQDLAVTNQSNVSNGVSILLGNGDGTFQSAVSYPAGLSPFAVAVGYFNGDANADLVIANIELAGKVSVLLGNGDGTFQSFVSYSTARFPENVKVADFNGDGKADVVAANFGDPTLSVSILLGNGNGTLQPATFLATGSWPNDVEVADFNGDTKADLAVINANIGDKLSIFLGNGNGTFQAPIEYPLGSNATFLSAGDLNADGRIDLAVTILDTDSVSVFLGNGNGTFPAPVNYATGTGPSGIDIADLNGDSKVDLAVANYSSSDVSALLGNGDGTFQGAQSFLVGNSPLGLAAAEFNGDSKADVAVANQGGDSASVLLSHSCAPPALAVTLTGPPSGSLYTIGAPVQFNATFTDTCVGTHTGTWTYDSISQSALIAEPSGSAPGTATATFAFTAAGVYTVRLTISSSCGASVVADQINGLQLLVVVYDPTAGFVTGGGWIDSQPGAYRAEPTLSGKANFGFVSKYNKGATIPTGETEFQFKVADFDFHGSVYQWLVIAGAKAQYKGTGTINSAGSYNFLLTATDGNISGGGGADKYRIKITDGDGGVVYDNALGSSDDIDSANPQIIGGGSIVIHK